MHLRVVTIIAMEQTVMWIRTLVLLLLVHAARASVAHAVSPPSSPEGIAANEPPEGTPVTEKGMAAGETPRDEARIEELERRQAILTEEIRRLRESLVLPERPELKSAYGLGPAASKVYHAEPGVSIGGYGEVYGSTTLPGAIGGAEGAEGRAVVDALRSVLYVGYKFSDRLLVNSELELEHGTTGGTVSSGGGSFSAEMLSLDFLLDRALNLRGGVLLVPVGFINEVHEPAFFHGVQRPIVERAIIPTTWRAGGAGAFGEIGERLSYRTYLVTSFNALGFSTDGLRGGRQKANRELARDLSWVGRLDYAMTTDSFVGVSAYVGRQGQNQLIDGVRRGVFMQLYEGHVQMMWRGLEVRALGAIVMLDHAGALSRQAGTTVANVLYGGYVEIAYDLLEDTRTFAPWVRISRLDTQAAVPNGWPRDATRDRLVTEVGLTYRPLPEVVLKTNYRVQLQAVGQAPDTFEIGMGYVF